MNRNLLCAVVASAVMVLSGGCVKDPTAGLRTNSPASLAVSNRYLTINVGDSARVLVTALDAQGNQLADKVTFTALDPTVTAKEGPSLAPVPGTAIYVKAASFGSGRVEVTLGTLKETILVNTLPATVRIAGQTDTLLRSGTTVQLTVEPLSITGGVVGAVTPVTWTSSNPTVATVSATGLVTGLIVGSTDITVTVPGGTTKIGYQVVPGVPKTAVFATAFGASGATGSPSREIRVLDSLGNQNTNLSEITAVTPNSSNTGTATVAGSFTDTASTGRRHVYVTATVVGSGATDISATVTTTNGVLPVAPSTLTILNPVISNTTMSSGPAAMVTINGTGLSQAGFVTIVRVDGKKLGNFTVVSPTQIDAQMPSFATTGAYSVVVSVGGVNSNTGTWTETSAFDEQEATNDDPDGGPPVLSFPFSFSGAFEGEPEEDDFFTITLSQPASLDILMNFLPAGRDLDILVSTTALPYNGGICSNGATGANPEHATCPNVPAGTYRLYLNDYDAYSTGDTTPKTYTIVGTIP